MAELAPYQFVLVALIFVWSGFVRSGLGFGGAALALPFLLLVHPEPVLFLPLLAVHLLIFSLWITHGRHRVAAWRGTGQATTHSQIDWRFLGYALAIMAVPKFIGIVGLLTLPGETVSLVICAIIAVYAVGYITNKPFASRHWSTDVVFLAIGGYASGISLIGAPLIAAVFASHVAREALRDTLFVTWFVVTGLKVIALMLAGVDMQWVHHLWLLPCVTAGHILGMRIHDWLQTGDATQFNRVLGTALLSVSALGIAHIAWP
ncbi:MAG: TSUP family transporter [Pseudomonadota bacterium]